MIFSIGWIAAYSYWLNFVTPFDCCVYWVTENIDSWGACDDPPLNYRNFINVSADFRGLCAWGIALYVIMLVCALGHCVKPLRCFTKAFSGITWFCVFILFITANVFRYRDSGRICANEDQ